jgi:hypothetical protein
MPHFFSHLLLMFGGTLVGLLALAGFLHLVPRLGRVGRRASEAFCRAPLLDVIITCFTVAPLVVGPIVFGWAGLLGGVIGQVATVIVWTALHEWANRSTVRGPRIVKVLNRLVGRWRNYAALWCTAPAAPGFWLVRVVEIVTYPPLCWLVGLPKYDSAQWVNVSRHKFSGLVGHDLIWCLYCDWMTGTWSLGSEMLRNVESFWCPIRFASNKKCENCRVDFPDIDHGWVDAGGTMADVAQVVEQAHGNGTHAWFGHPVRVTVEGREVVRDASDDAPEVVHT